MGQAGDAEIRLLHVPTGGVSAATASRPAAPASRFSVQISNFIADGRAGFERTTGRALADEGRPVVRKLLFFHAPK